jgi:hypothetical protein
MSRADQIEQAILENLGGPVSPRGIAPSGGTLDSIDKIRDAATDLFDNCKHHHPEVAASVLHTLVSLLELERMPSAAPSPAPANVVPLPSPSASPAMRRVEVLQEIGAALEDIHTRFAKDDKDIFTDLDALEVQILSWQSQDKAQPWTSLLRFVWAFRAFTAGDDATTHSECARQIKRLQEGEVDYLCEAYPFPGIEALNDKLVQEGVLAETPVPSSEEVADFESVLSGPLTPEPPAQDFDQLEHIEAEVREKAAQADTAEQLGILRRDYLGKEGRVSQLLRKIGEVDPPDRVRVGVRVGEVTVAVGEIFDARLLEIKTDFSGPFGEKTDAELAERREEIITSLQTQTDDSE